MALCVNPIISIYNCNNPIISKSKDNSFNTCINKSDALSAISYSSIYNISNNNKSSKSKQVTFTGRMTYEQEKSAKNCVHLFAGACGATSATVGELAITGIEPWILRGEQFIMFSILQDKLNVPVVPSLMYMGKEMVSGAVIGVEGAKWLTAATGLAIDFLSGGTATLPSTGGVRAINGTLSAAITEKMGRGYIKRVKHDQMTLGSQLFEVGGYLGMRFALSGWGGITDMFADKISGATDIESVKDALASISDSDKALVGELFSNLVQGLHVDKFAYTCTTMFAMKMLTCFKNGFSKEKTYEYAKAAFKEALLTTAIYDLCDISVGKTISESAKNTIIDIRENLENYPEVYQKFLDSQKQFLDAIDLDTLDLKSFRAKFTNKDFVYNLSVLTKDMIKDFKIAWGLRNNSAMAKKMLEANQNIKKEKEKGEKISNSISADVKLQVANELNKDNRILSVQSDLMIAKSGFGFELIAGYEREKQILTEKFLKKVAMEKSGGKTNVPNVIMLFGPTNTGKSTMAKALSQQGMCKFNKLKSFETIDTLKDKINIATHNFKNSKQRTVILVDEAEQLNRKPEILNYILEISKQKRCPVTFILTTNNPRSINPKLLANSLNIGFGPANIDDIIKILKKYLSKKVDSDFNFNNLAREIYNKYNSVAISNSQIEGLCVEAIEHGGVISYDDMILLVNKLHPEISEQDLKNFQEEMKKFRG